MTGEAIVGLAALAWSFGALYFDLHVPAAASRSIAVFWALAALVAWFGIRPRGWWRGATVIAFAGIATWWLMISPRQDRDWKPEVALLASTTTDGDQVTVRSVRNFAYRSETDFTPRYETHRYDLRQLRGLDLFITYWGSPFIAHPIVSFDFGPQGRICFSIETRAERGETYSAIGGLYRQFELIYIAAEERDVIRLRTNFRQGEDVYLYHLNLPPNEARARFSEYARRVEELHARPEWYNAITTNCTTSIRSQHGSGERVPWDWRILANGKADEMLYERSILDRTLGFADLKRRAYINQRAKTAGDATDFSELIRAEAAPLSRVVDDTAARKYP